MVSEVNKMDLSIPAPGKFDCDAEGADWKKWRREFELFAGLAMESKDEKAKIMMLQYLIGAKGREIYETLQFCKTDGTKIPDKDVKVDDVLEAFDKHFNPTQSETVQRYKFLTRMQAHNETFESFLSSLQTLAATCNLGDLKSSLIRDRIICGINNDTLRGRLLRENKLSLDDCLKHCRTHEMTKQRSAEFNSLLKGDQEVHALRKTFQRQRPQETRKCKFCGESHKFGARFCPAYGKTCTNCNRPNHYAKVCNSTRAVNEVAVAEEQTQDDDVENDQEANQEDHFFLESLDLMTVSNNQAFVNIHIEGQIVKMKLDTGSQVNALPIHLASKLGEISLRQTTSKLHAYGGQKINILGTQEFDCQYKNQQKRLTFYIVEGPSTPILGLSACLDLNLIKLIGEVEKTYSDIFDTYADIFEGLGVFPGEYDIAVNPDATPVVHPPRSIPFARLDAVKKELVRMEQAGVIAKVTEPTPWVNSMVIVEKPNGQLRVCLDPKDLNEAIIRPHYKMPTVDEVTVRLNSSTTFSKLDARSGYWLCKLSYQSSLLTTFNSPLGRFRFLRLPFGLCCSQDIFQRKIDEFYGDLPGVAAIVDDIVVFGKSQADHDRNLMAVLDRCRKIGVKLNKEKCQLNCPEVNFFGMVFSDSGIRPDPAKIKAITNMPAPKDKAELRTLLGMITFLSKHIPQLAEIGQPMRALLKESVDFVWDHAQEQSFESIKNVLSQNIALAYFDPDKEVEIEADASKHGLGAVLKQGNQPVYYASKALTETEQHYAQIEKEMYAILFACERFHQYIYGKHVKVYSDHKPIEAIMRKPLHLAPARLQRMMLRLRKYTLTIQFQPGHLMYISDTLSRLHSADTDATVHDYDWQVYSVVRNLPISDAKLQQVKKCTSTDSSLQCLSDTILKGWPNERNLCPTSIQDYWNYRDELSVYEDIVMKGERLVIPKDLRVDILRALHVGHFGIEKTKQRARTLVFWPGINGDIENMSKSCGKCQLLQASNQKEPILQHETPQGPWQVLGSDFFTVDGRNYIVVVDYYSLYFEIQPFSCITSLATVNYMKTLFSRFGIPLRLVSDNAPQYASQTFKMFAKEWGFEHVTSSPHYPQSNGLAEKTVAIAKRIVLKATDVPLALLEYRNTPVLGGKFTPAQLLMGRNLRSVLPLLPKHLHPVQLSEMDIKASQQQRKERQAYYYNQHAKPLSKLSAGTNVQIKHLARKWTPATVMLQADQPRSYILRTHDGAEYRRNRRDIIPIATHPAPTEETTKAATTNPEQREKSTRVKKLPEKLRDPDVLLY